MKSKNTRLPLYNVNGKTYIGRGKIVQDSDLIYDPEYILKSRVIAINSDSILALGWASCPVGKLVGMFTNIRYKYDTPMTKV